MKNPQLTISGMDGSVMYDRFYRDPYPASSDLFDRIRYLNSSEMFKEYHFVCHTADDIVVGDLGLQQSPFEGEADLMWMKHVSVDKHHRQQGIATELMEAAIGYCREHGKTLQMSSYSDEGKLYLRPLVRRLRQDWPDVEIAPPQYDDDDLESEVIPRM